MSALGIDPDGAAVGKWLARDVGLMFLQVLGEPAATVAEHEAIPATRGVYLFSEGDRTVMVGLADDLRRALLAAVSPDADEGSTYLSFNLARRLARRSGMEVDGERQRLEANREFVGHFKRAKETVPDLFVRFITHGDFLQCQMLALYLEVRLNTQIPSRLYPEWEGPASFGKLAATDQDDPPAGTLTTVGFGGGSVTTATPDDAPCAELDPEDAKAPRPSTAQLGRAIAQVRKGRRLTQEQVAERASVVSSYLSFIETGKRNVSWKVLTAISAALEVSTATLVARAEES